MKPLPCPFCGAGSVGRADGPDARPFYVRCSRERCPGFNTGSTFAEEDVALSSWNRRVQLPPESRDTIHSLVGFTTTNLIRGELVGFDLDRTGVLVSDKIQFSPHSRPLMPKPQT